MERVASRACGPQGADRIVVVAALNTVGRTEAADRFASNMSVSCAEIEAARDAVARVGAAPGTVARVAVALDQMRDLLRDGRVTVEPEEREGLSGPMRFVVRWRGHLVEEFTSIEDAYQYATGLLKDERTRQGAAFL